MAAFTRTYVTNLALALIGTERIEDYNDDDAAAALARDVWDVCVLECLEAHEWRWAAETTQLQQGTNPDVGYDHKYQLPANFARINAVYSSSTMLQGEIIEDWEIRGGWLHTDSDYVFIDYVRDDVAIGAWPAYFAQYVAAVLAFHISSTQKSTSETERFYQVAMQRLGIARSRDSTQQPTRRPPPGRWIRAVRGNYRTV